MPFIIDGGYTPDVTPPSYAEYLFNGIVSIGFGVQASVLKYGRTKGAFAGRTVTAITPRARAISYKQYATPNVPTVIGLTTTDTTPLITGTYDTQYSQKGLSVTVDNNTYSVGSVGGSSIVFGYWINNPTVSTQQIRLNVVPTQYDVVAVTEAIPTSPTNMTMTFTPNVLMYPSNAVFISEIQALQAKGQKVILNVGTNYAVNLGTTTQKNAFVSSLTTLAQTFGFDGINFDFMYGDVLERDVGDNDYINPTTTAILNAINAITTIHSNMQASKPSFIISVSPDTLFLQAGYDEYSTATDRRQGSLIPIIYGIKDIVDYVQPKYVGTLDVYGKDGVLYHIDDNSTDAQKANFYVAMTEMLLSGFAVDAQASKGSYLREVFISTTGSSSGTGAVGSPWDWATGRTQMKPGDHVNLRGGTYTTTNTGDGYYPAFCPGASGTGISRDKRIHIQNYNGETVTLAASGNGPVFGTYNNDYVWWEGITTTQAQEKNAIIYGGQYNRIRNCDVGGATVATTDNADGIRLENTKHAIVEYNKVHGSSNSVNNHNACGIKVYGSQDCIIKYNDIYNNGSGIDLKAQGTGQPVTGCKVWRNHIHDLIGDAVAFVSTTTSHDNEWYENLVDGVTQGMWMFVYDVNSPLNNFPVYNNTFVNTTNLMKYGQSGDAYNGAYGIKFYDNICAYNTGYEMLTFVNPFPPEIITTWDYNLYYRSSGAFTVRFASTDYNWTQWKGYAGQVWDVHSAQATAPLFVNYAGKDYQLQTGSPAKNAGRYGDDLGCFAKMYWLPDVGQNGPGA